MEFVKRNPKIFIISGKAKSGKDTVGKMIEAHYHDKKCIELAYAYYLKDYAKRITDWNGEETTKPRLLLQQLGVELIKEKIDKHLLIDRLLEDIEVFSYFYDIIYITDARLIEEIEIPKERYPEAITIRVNRENYENGLTKEEQDHITETGLDHYHNYDYVIDNNQDLNALEKKVECELKEVDNA